MDPQLPPAHPAVMEAQTQSTALRADAPIPKPMFTTQRLIVRELHPKDAASMQLIANDKEVLKYMSLAFSYPYTIEHANQWISMNLGLAHQVAYAICEISSPDIAIGGIGLKPGSDVRSHTAEVGFWIGKKFWGQGYTTEALKAFTDWCFESWEGENGQRAKKLFAAVFSGNVGSMRCFEKCGYAVEGVFRGHAEKYGVTYDEHFFGMTKKDWESISWQKTDILKN